MKVSNRQHSLRQWWEFYELYDHLARRQRPQAINNMATSHRHRGDFSKRHCYHHRSIFAGASAQSRFQPIDAVSFHRYSPPFSANSFFAHSFSTHYGYTPDNSFLRHCVHQHPVHQYSNEVTQHHLDCHLRSKKSLASLPPSSINDHKQAVGSQAISRGGGGSRQNQIKRQKEWIYLCHYIAISGLNPLHIISGQDDGREPDFTLIFYRQARLYYIGIELTTLPRLRDHMSEEALIGKRWYWQGLQVMAKFRQKMPSYQRFKLPVQTIYMPADTYQQRLSNLPHSPITQDDIDAVMVKKAHKVAGYRSRRPLDELWLLVHTDKYQPDCILTTAKKPLALYHTSGFDQIQLTRYPSHKIINVRKQ